MQYNSVPKSALASLCRNAVRYREAVQEGSGSRGGGSSGGGSSGGGSTRRLKQDGLI
jgi:hypothetical protein